MKSRTRVVTLTLHPAIDRIVRLSSMQPGETFEGRLQLAVPAGKGVNTARSLRPLCKPATQIVAAVWLGENEATWFKRQLLNDGIRTAICPRPVATRFAHSYLEHSGRETHIKESMPPADAPEQARLLEFWKITVRPGDIVAVCGSSPGRMKPATLKAIFSIARERGARAVIADTHGQALAAAAVSNIDVLKGNAAEIGAWLGCAASFDRHNASDCARLLNSFSKRGAPQRILVTLGSAGALLACPKHIFFQVPPKLSADFSIVSATGCGDAATAGIVWSLIARDTLPEKMLSRSVACGSAKLASADPGGLSVKWVSKFIRDAK